LAIWQAFRVAMTKGSKEAQKVVQTLREGWEAGKTSAAIESQLKREGLSYRRQNFLEDWRRAGAISRVKSGNVEGTQRALEYFDKVIEPYRKQEGLNFQQALRDIHKWEKNREKLVEAGDELAQRAIQYGFDTSP